MPTPSVHPDSEIECREGGRALKPPFLVYYRLQVAGHLRAHRAGVPVSLTVYQPPARLTCSSLFGVMYRLCCWAALLTVTVTAMLPLLGVLLAACSIWRVEGLSYRYTSFATQSPEEAVSFCVDYLDAIPVHSNRSSDGDAVKAVRLPFALPDGLGGFQSEIHFRRSNKPDSAPGFLTVEEFEDYLVSLHGDLAEDTWDRWLDWHLAFTVADLDVVAARLLRDGKKFVTRSHSLFVELPHGQIIQILSDHMAAVWTEPFFFCRYTNQSDIPPVIDLEIPGADIEELASRPVGALTPSHHSFNSRAPEVAQKFLLTYTDAVAIEPGDDVHEYGNGTCALLKWVQFTEQPRYQIHFVDNWRKRDGPLSTSLLEDYWTRLHGNLTDLAVEDDFMGNRMGFATKDLTPIRKKLAADGVPVRDRGSSLLVSVPPGELLLEIVEEHDDQ